MQQTNIPGLGASLRNWRVRQRQTPEQWADAIFRAGFSQWGDPGTACDPDTLGQGLVAMETTDTWPFGDFDVEAPEFLQACKAALVHGGDDQADLNRVTLLCSRHLFFHLYITGLFP